MQLITRNEGNFMPAAAPIFALVSAVYNVDRYLQEFLESLDAQTIDHSRLRVILVDDGSTDGSGETLDSWASRTDFAATVVHQENAGQGAARTAGLNLLDREDWVTFVDPDDFLAEDYFQNVDAFLSKHPSAVMAVGHQQDYFDDGRSEQVDNHPLRFRFSSGDRLVNLNNLPRFIQLSAATAFVKVEILKANPDLEFDSRIKPNFEDGHFVNMYLLRAPEPLVGFVGTAAYYYRRRSDGTSTLQQAIADPRKYTDVLEFGYLPLMRSALNLKGSVPEWIQTTVLYDLTWIFRADEQRLSETAGLTADTCRRFHELTGACRAMMDPHVVQGFDILKRSLSHQEAILYGYSSSDWHWENVLIEQVDSDHDMVKLRYRYCGSQPHEEFFLDGEPIQPHHRKTRSVDYLQQALVHERIVWVSNEGRLSVRLNSERAGLTYQWPHLASMSYTGKQISGRIGPRKSDNRTRLRKFASKVKHYPAQKPQRQQLKLERRASARSIRAKYNDAWVLMDRDINANDNAEHLFRYIRSHHQEINAWFVVKEGTPDWYRLKEEGVHNLIGYGTPEWKLLCLNASHIVSSHADAFVYQPFRRTGGWKWKFIFLQHGVTKDDISRWIGPKPIRGLITSTPDEYSSIAGPSNYPFSTREVARTGMPRFDRLRELVAKQGESKTVLVMPTWRQYLVGERTGNGSQSSRLNGFGQTRFAREWAAMLGSDVLRSLVKQHDLQVVFMPHPNLEDYLEEIDVPDFVRVASYGTHNVQELIASSALMITDYSSVAFDSALVRKPVAYFQFDRDEVFGGKHNTRPGYFSYVKHGFGPLSTTLSQLEAALPSLLSVPGKLTNEYHARVESAFAGLPENSSEAVVAFIQSMTQPLTAKQALEHTPEPAAVINQFELA